MIAKSSIAMVGVFCLSSWLTPVRADEPTAIVVPPSGEGSGYVVAPGVQRFSGKIDHVDKKKDAAGVKHEVVRLKADTGEIVMIDLGPSDALHGLDLGKNDRISVVAVPGQFNGQPAFVAERVTDKDGKTARLATAPPVAPAPVAQEYGEAIRIERMSPAAPVPSGVAAAPRRTIEGQLLDTWTTNVPDYGAIQMARVRGQDGEIVTVDLGPRSNLPAGFALTGGSWVQVSGFQTQSNGQPLLVAETLMRSVRIR